jgi:hypothetical protein
MLYRDTSILHSGKQGLSNGLMRVLVTISLLLLIISPIAAQKGLKRSVSNGATTYATAEKKIFARPGSKNAVGDILKSTFYRYPNGYSLCFYVQSGRSSHFSISAGAEVVLKWADGNSISLRCRSASQSAPSRLDYGGWLYAFYGLSASQLTMLAQQPLQQINISSSTGWMEYPLTDRSAKLVMEQAALIR